MTSIQKHDINTSTNSSLITQSDKNDKTTVKKELVTKQQYNYPLQHPQYIQPQMIVGQRPYMLRLNDPFSYHDVNINTTCPYCLNRFHIQLKGSNRGCEENDCIFCNIF